MVSIADNMLEYKRYSIKQLQVTTATMSTFRNTIATFFTSLGLLLQLEAEIREVVQYENIHDSVCYCFFPP